MRKLADELHDYMSVRAVFEGEPYAHSSAYFALRLATGAREFFGVHCTDSAIVADDHAPDFFALYQTRRGDPALFEQVWAAIESRNYEAFQRLFTVMVRQVYRLRVH